jgi:hypothetical protein
MIRFSSDPIIALHSLKLRREYGQAGVGIGRQARTFLDRQQTL